MDRILFYWFLEHERYWYMRNVAKLLCYLSDFRVYLMDAISRKSRVVQSIESDCFMSLRKVMGRLFDWERVWEVILRLFDWWMFQAVWRVFLRGEMMCIWACTISMWCVPFCKIMYLLCNLFGHMFSRRFIIMTEWAICARYLCEIQFN